jgi:hypothetical protein
MQFQQVGDGICFFHNLLIGLVLKESKSVSKVLGPLALFADFRHCFDAHLQVDL